MANTNNDNEGGQPAASGGEGSISPTSRSTLEPCPSIGPGWTVRSVPRSKRSGSGSRVIDRFFHSPCGRVFRSKRAVERFLGDQESGRHRRVPPFREAVATAASAPENLGELGETASTTAVTAEKKTARSTESTATTAAKRNKGDGKNDKENATTIGITKTTGDEGTEKKRDAVENFTDKKDTSDEKGSADEKIVFGRERDEKEGGGEGASKRIATTGNAGDDSERGNTAGISVEQTSSDIRDKREDDVASDSPVSRRADTTITAPIFSSIDLPPTRRKGGDSIATKLSPATTMREGRISGMAVAGSGERICHTEERGGDNEQGKGERSKGDNEGDAEICGANDNRSMGDVGSGKEGSDSGSDVALHDLDKRGGRNSTGIPSLLDSPVKNIRLRVRTSSGEILDVACDPVVGDTAAGDADSGDSDSTGGTTAAAHFRKRPDSHDGAAGKDDDLGGGEADREDKREAEGSRERDDVALSDREQDIGKSNTEADSMDGAAMDEDFGSDFEDDDDDPGVEDDSSYADSERAGGGSEDRGSEEEAMSNAVDESGDDNDDAAPPAPVRGDLVGAPAGEGDSRNRGNMNDKESHHLYGATIRIKGGKFDGKTGRITEVQSYRHAFLDTLPPLGPVHADDIEIISSKENADPSGLPSIEFGREYVGSKVRVKEPHERSGAVGLVTKVIVGDWYITDNREITNAFQEHKFEVIRYAASSSNKRSGEKVKVVEEVERAPSREEISVEKVTSAQDQQTGREKGRNVEKAESQAFPREVGRQARGADSNLGISEEGEGTGQAARSCGTMGDSAARVAHGNKAGPPSTAAAAARAPPRADRAGAMPPTHDDDRDLTGATIRITRGRFRGRTACIRERLRIRRLEIDAVPDHPFDFPDVEVLSYRDGSDAMADEDCPDEFARKFQKYVGARVRVLTPLPFQGTVGKVVRIIVLGDWYIMDDPDIPMAFPEHKFEVLERPPDQGVGGDGEDGTDTVDTHCKSGGIEGKARRVQDIEGNEAGESKIEKGPMEEEADDADGGGKVKTDEATEFPTTVYETATGNDIGAYSQLRGKEDSGEGGPEKVSKDDEMEETSMSRSAPRMTLNQDIQSEGSSNIHVKGIEARNQSNTPNELILEGDAMPSPARDGEIDGNGETPEENEDQGQHGEGESKDDANYSAGLIGATVYIWTGKFRGLSGKLLCVQTRGWWTIDNPRVTNKIKSGVCKFVDDGSFSLANIRQWYKMKGMIHKMPSVIKPGEENEEEEVQAMAVDGDDDSISFKRKLDQTNFTLSDERTTKLGVIEQGPPRLDGTSSNSHTRKRRRHQRHKMRSSTEPALNPILLHMSDEHSAGRKQRLKMQLLPDSLRHLPQDTMIEIFNRRTCKIMKGDEAIPLSELPTALMDHAEYEPIVPPPARSSTSARVGRSGPNIRVSRNVIPQTRVRASRVEGRDVLVTGGEYRGLSGKIDSCIPGGWYMVSNLFHNDKLDVVVHSNNLRLLPPKATCNNALSTERQGNVMTRIHLKAAKLRLERYDEERDRLKNNVSTGRVTVQLTKLESLVSDTKKRIADLQHSLDTSPNDSVQCK